MTFTFTRIANTNTPIPGGEDTFIDFSFPSSALIWPAINDNGDVAFFGDRSEEGHGIYLYNSVNEQISTVVDSNTLIPDDPLPNDNQNTFLSLFPPSLNNNGDIAFHALVGMSDESGIPRLHSGIYTTAGGLQRVADENTPIPNDTENFEEFRDFPSLNDNGTVSFVGIRGVSGGVPGNQEFGGVYTKNTGDLEVVADYNSLIPGRIEKFNGLRSYSSSLNNNETIVFQGENRVSGTDTPIVQGIYSSSEGVLTTVVDTNTVIPNRSDTFKFVSLHVLNENSNTAFLGFDSNDQPGIYIDGSNGIDLIADTNTLIPEGIGNFVTFISEQDPFGFFGGNNDLLSLDNNGTVAFAGIGTQGQQGIYTHSNGVLSAVIDQNILLEGKVIQDLAFGTEGLSGDQLVFSAQFTDGTEGIYVATNAPVELSLSIDSTSISEAAGEDVATVTVTRTGGTAAALDVTLASGDVNELLIPLTVTIPADQTSATVSIDAVDDLVNDGDQIVEISAIARGFSEETITITVTDDEQPPAQPPVISNELVDFERAENTTFVVNIDTTDEKDSEGNGLTYGLSGGQDIAQFLIDESTGELGFANSPDFENPSDADTNNSYQVEVIVTDSDGLFDTQLLNINVTDEVEPLPEPPVIISNQGNPQASLEILENTSLVADINTVDDRDSESNGLRYSLTAGEDIAQFTIDSNAGILTFINSLDFENPTDLNGDNSYQVEVTVTDSDGLFDTQLLNINVTDELEPLPEPPVIISNDGNSQASLEVLENTILVVDTDATDDQDSESNGLSYSLTAGEDIAQFTIDANTGILTFINSPDFENPTDLNGDNSYQVEATVTDSDGLKDSQFLDVQVIGEGEGPPDTFFNSISGVLFQDGDEDGTFDLEEPTLPANITVNLRDENNTITTTITNNLGNYRFDNLADGTYSVQVDAADSEIPANLIPSLNPTEPISVAQGEIRSGIDFAFAISTEPRNTPPVAEDESVSTPFNTEILLSLADNVSDAEGPVDLSTIDFNPTISGIQNTLEVINQGTFTVTDTNGNIRFTPVQDFTGLVKIPYTVQDGEGSVSNVAQITVNVNPVINQPPIAIDDQAETLQNQQVVVSVLENDSDPENDSINLEGFDATSANGGSIIQEGNALIYIPALDFSGTDTFNYEMSDGTDEDTATVTVQVNENPIPPDPPEEPETVPTPRSEPEEFEDCDCPPFPTEPLGLEVIGSSGNDTLEGTSADEQISALEGADWVIGEAGLDWISGNAGTDYLLGHLGADSLSGGSAVDTLFGGQGNDLVYGDEGSDLLFGDRGNDWICGGDRDDTLFGDWNQLDTASAETNDTLCGGTGNDVLLGNASQAELCGGEGRDTVYAGQGDDTLRGDAGDDWLSGDLGDDFMIGGEGSDQFVLAVDQGSDVVLDFINGQDQLALIGNLSFEQLTISEVNGSTSISLGNNRLALIDGIVPGLITVEDFVSVG